MIDAVTLKEKMGKKAFVDFAVNNRYRGESMKDVERRRARGRNFKFRMCQHGTWVIDNYVRKPCKDCRTEVKRFQPRDVDYTGFNAGLGVYTDGYSDFKRALKHVGAVQLGTDKR